MWQAQVEHPSGWLSCIGLEQLSTSPTARCHFQASRVIPRPNIFEQAWWLDLCATGQWDRISTTTKYGNVDFTYAARRRFAGFREIYRPPLTPFLGFSSNDGLGSLDLSSEHRLLQEVTPEVVQLLPDYLRFKMNFHPSFTWWSPFFWQGFRQTTRYTYQLDLSLSTAELWANLSSNARRNVKKARRSVEVTSGNFGSELYELFNRTMQAQGKSPGYPGELLVRITDEAYRRDAGTVLLARDGDGKPHAGLLLVWHADEAYYLVGGSDPDLRQSGAMMLLMWTAIELAQDMAAVFDFEGSMQKGIERFIRNFGALPVPYHQIYRSPLTRWLG
jgi:hypothetical protein